VKVVVKRVTQATQVRAPVLDALVARWRAGLPRRYDAHVDGFLIRNRAQIEVLVAGTVARRKANRGERPETAEEFAAYDPIVTRERPHSAAPHKTILARLMKRIDAELAEGYRELTVYNNLGLEYIDTHAEAILLRNIAWDAVPLLLEVPVLAVVSEGAVVALRDTMGSLAIHRDRRGTLNRLFGDLDRAERRIIELREGIGIKTDTKDRLTSYARALWTRARASFPLVTPRLPDP
jgi:hypothetical protein